MALPSPTTSDLRSFYLRVRALGESPRYWSLHRAEALWKGMQYADRPSWWNADIPVRVRAPLIVYPVARSAGLRLVSMVFGEGRFPALSVGNGGSELRGVQLSPEDAKTLTTGATNVIAAARLRLGMRNGLEMGLAARTACAIVSLRAGKLRVDWVWAKWCTPTFDPCDDERVTRLVVRYQHEEADALGQPQPVWYRRVIDETSDTTWDGVPVDPNGYEPDWDRWAPTRRDALEFCPVVWIRNLPDPGAIGDVDGRALFDGLEDEVEAVDRALSQRDRNALLNGDPQVLLTGASREDLEASPGRVAAANPGLAGKVKDLLARSQAAANAMFGGSGQAIRKGAGEVWALNKEGADGKILESTGAGAQILTNHANDLRAKLLETVGVVMLDPEKAASGEIAEATLKTLYAPMVALCDDLRECWGDALLRVLGTCLRMLTTKAARDAQGFAAVRGIPNADALLRVLARFFQPVARPDGTSALAWLDPPLALEWGDYFDTSWAERLASAQAAGQAIGDGVLSKRTAIQQLAPVWGVEDVEAELEALGQADVANAQATRNLLSSVMQERADGAAPPAANAPPAHPAPPPAKDSAP